MSISERELTSLVDSQLDFLKAFDHASKEIHIPQTVPKIEIGSTKSKDNLFAHFYNDMIEHPKRQIRLSFWFGNNNSCVFSIKKFELHGNQFIVTEIVNLSHLYKKLYYVANKCEIFESNYDVYRIYPECVWDNSTIILIGDVYYPNTKCSCKFCLHKKIFNLSAEAIINVLNARQCVRCAIFLSKIKQAPFYCRLAQGFTLLRKIQNQFRILLELRIVLASIFSTERIANLLPVM